jgi:branched-chain amino acid transport system ATP-binding protein
MAMLKVENLSAAYGAIQVLWNISFEIADGETVAILGGNGAGKTTMVRALSGQINASGGGFTFNGENLSGASTRKILNAGIVQIPEGRQLFTGMTVYENLELGAFNKEAKKHLKKNLEMVYEWFPKLKERSLQLAGTLSGGEQQIVAVARGILGMPKLLILDEPSLGLAPNIVDQILRVTKDLVRTRGISIMLVEQDVHKALKTSDRGYVMENGNIVLHDTARNLLNNDQVKKAYLGF